MEIGEVVGRFGGWGVFFVESSGSVFVFLFFSLQTSFPSLFIRTDFCPSAGSTVKIDFDSLLHFSLPGSFWCFLAFPRPNWGPHPSPQHPSLDSGNVSLSEIFSSFVAKTLCCLSRRLHYAIPFPHPKRWLDSAGLKGAAFLSLWIFFFSTVKILFFGLSYKKILWAYTRMLRSGELSGRFSSLLKCF